MRFFAPAAVAALLSSPAPAAPIVVTVSAKRLLDVESGRVVRDPVVRIENGVVTSVGTRAPGEAVTHDLGDVTLLPGLVDAHVHLVGAEGFSPYQQFRETAASAALAGVPNARKTLDAGFTTVRDLGARDLADAALRDAIASGRVAGPRMLVAVKSLSPTGGHGDLNELPYDCELHRYSGIADGPEEIRKKVRENVKYGADWIKVLATGGVMSAGTDPRRADYTEEEIRAAVLAAKEKGRDVAVHAHAAEGIKRAIRAGVRSVEHASFLDDEAIALAKEKGTFLVMNPYTNAYMLENPGAGYAPFQLEKARVVYREKVESLKKAVKAGLAVAFGTDSGVQAHGLNARQLAIYVEAGMTPLQAIQSATLTAARLLRMETRIGKVAPGYFGDLVAVAGDPLKDVRTLEAPRFVLKEGRLVFERR